MDKAFVKLKGFLLYCRVLNLCRSCLKGVPLYNEVDKCGPLLYYSLPSGSNVILRRGTKYA